MIDFTNYDCYLAHNQIYFLGTYPEIVLQTSWIQSRICIARQRGIIGIGLICASQYCVIKDM